MKVWNDRNKMTAEALNAAESAASLKKIRDFSGPQRNQRSSCSKLPDKQKMG
jgi:hypothetical protein